MKANQILYPQVSQVPGSKRATPEKRDPAVAKDFGAALDKSMQNLDQSASIRAPLKISSHATQRLRDRGIEFSQELKVKVNEAVDKAAAKGLEDALVITDDAAFIVSAKNRTIVTALDKGSLTGNVFTNIDGAVIV